MKENEKEMIGNTIAERGKWIRLGFLPVYIRPLTLLQVNEIGESFKEIAEEIDDESHSVSSYILTHPNDAKCVIDGVVKAVFRSKIMRFLFGSIVMRNLTTENYKKIFAHIHSAFEYDFFLTSLIFLRGVKVKKKTEMQKDTTKAETPRGEWSDL